MLSPASSASSGHELEDDEHLLAEAPPSGWQQFVARVDEMYGPLPQLEPPNASWLSRFGTLLAQNWKSGLTVSLISVPLSLSLAIANGGTPVMGMITAVWSGLVASLCGGSEFNIHGPTGALSGIVNQFAVQYGYDVLPFLALLSGVMSLLFFLLRLDRYVMFIPSAVMHGFTFGVAFIIGGGQLGFALGLPKLQSHVEFIENLFEGLKNADKTNPWAVLLFLACFSALLFLVSRWPKVPWMVFVAAIGTGIGYLTVRFQHVPSVAALRLQTLGSRYPNLQPDLFKPALPIRADFLTMGLLTAALSVCFISVLETLISARIADRLTNTQHHQPAEVLGLGLSNIVSGLFGGLPSTAALARTALNVRSGATSRVSGVVNAVAVTAISLVLLPVFQYLLLPVIAAILVVVSVRMVEAEALVHMYKYDRKMFWLCLLVTLVVIVKDPTSGIVLGAILALFMFAAHNARGHGEASFGKGAKMLSNLSLEEVDKNLASAEKKRSATKAFGDTLVYRIPGELTYLNAPSHLERVRRVAEQYNTVIIALRYLFYLDIDGLDALGDLVKALEARGKRVMLSGVHDSVKAMLEKTAWFSQKVENGFVFASYRDALIYLDSLEAGDAPASQQEEFEQEK